MDRFEGWYFKHQKGDDTVAFIPGQAGDGAFIQMLSPSGSRQFSIPSLSVSGGMIQAGTCRFSPVGCVIDLPGVTGQVGYGPWTPLRSDIMGPFRFFPMECRHGVLSMHHSLQGSLVIDGTSYCFDGGVGYAETDRGISFPKSYLWLQCGDFPEPCSILASIARIPFCGGHFTGCICALWHRGREYRLATYCGVRIRAADPTHLCLTQGQLRLDVRMEPSQAGHPLRSPIRGQMHGVIRESCNTAMEIRLWEKGQLILHLRSRHGTYESFSGA